MKKIPKLFGIHTITYIVILELLCVVNYINISVVLIIYFPIFLISALFMGFKKNYLFHIFLLSAEIGIIAEYLLSLNNINTPSMKGAFLNVTTLFIGLIVGIIVQICMPNNKNR